MKLISLCTKIHIPVIYHKHPFSELNITDQFFDERQTRRHVLEVSEHKLLPFLKSAHKLSERYGSSFKMAVSLSGITIMLLGKYVPSTLDEIRLLVKNGTIQFLAEPWSNSILSYFIQKDLIQQTELQRRTIEGTFGQLPTVSMEDLPLNAGIFSEFKPIPNCNTVFTCSNHLNRYLRNNKTSNTKKVQFLINHTLSQKLQQLSSDGLQSVDSNQIVPFNRYLRKHASLVKPLILVFDPLAKNISSFKKWEEIISQLLNKTQCSFHSLSDLEEISNYFSIENDYSEDMLSQFKYPDHWMKNSMQKEAFKQFRNIYKTIHTYKYPYLREAWDFLQDLNNFFYMSDSFFLENFARQHFSPFRSPHEAFTSYMNAVSNFWIVSSKKTSPIIKTNYFITPTIN